MNSTESGATDGDSDMRRRTGPSRREFLCAGAAACTVGLTSAMPLRAGARTDRRCIFVWLTGGPSHIDTFDPKPNAPMEVRGPFRPIASSVPGLQISELFPMLSARANQIAFIRSMHHGEAPIHETGQQLLQTGMVSHEGRDYPHVGAVLSAQGLGPWAILPTLLGDTGVGISHGQSAGAFAPAHAPSSLRSENLLGESANDCRRYGEYEFGRSCLKARRLIESGTRLAVVNMFSTVYDTVSWDCHADGRRLKTSLSDYRNVVAPMFDRTFSALLDDLADRGLLESTLVVAAGEFGRTPRLNPLGGRDHWPGVWTVLMAGAGIHGGAVIGSSDAIGSAPADRPVTPAEFVASIYHVIGVQPPEFVSARPLAELLM